MVAASAALPVMATGQDVSAAYRDAAQAKGGGGAGLALGPQRARPVVEQRCQPHESRVSESLLRPAAIGLNDRHQPAPSASLVNRRMRNRTYGGVGGGRRIPAPYPMLIFYPQRNQEVIPFIVEAPCF